MRGPRATDGALTSVSVDARRQGVTCFRHVTLVDVATLGLAARCAGHVAVVTVAAPAHAVTCAVSATTTDVIAGRCQHTQGRTQRYGTQWYPSWLVSIQEVVSLLTDQLTIVVDKLVARLTSTRVSPRRVLTVLRRRAGLLVILHAFVYIVTELS